MELTQWLWWIPALPLLGSILAGSLHFQTLRRRAQTPSVAPQSLLAGWTAVAAIAGSFALALRGFFQLEGSSTTELISSSWQWIDAGNFDVGVAMVLDRLSSVMCLVITGVGLLIHIYAVGYMKEDPGFAKFFAYLNLFVTMMLVLVLSSSLLGLFVGWEGVGLCSYLLIGFWYQKGWPAEAAQKAFVVNRIGDACFLLGGFLCAKLFGSLELSEICAGVLALAGDPAVAGSLALAALLLFAGACGKSAQIPLFVWLPDAMAGPTPVSALIHAATMVTAGIYLIVRTNPLFAASPGVLLLVGSVGAITALIAGSSAIQQRDLKKVLAYSTVSQLGYMFLALGSGAFVAAIFHLVTHAFFKALLFLGAGSVIHGMHEEQDMHRMGGLAHHMPRTFLTFLIGAGALSGLPPLAGFFSKDEILALSFAQGGAYYLLWAIGLITAAMTAYYSWRMVALVFFGEERFDARHLHPHESPALMTVPLMLLALLAVGGGLLGLPAVLHLPHWLHHWLEPVTQAGTALLHQGQSVPHLSHSTEWVLLGLGTLIAFGFAHLGFRSHNRGLGGDRALMERYPKLTALWANAWRIDQGFATYVIAPIRLLSFAVAVVVDALIIDGAVHATAAMARGAAERVRRLADGSISGYALWMGVSTVLLALGWMWWGTP